MDTTEYVTYFTLPVLLFGLAGNLISAIIWFTQFTVVGGASFFIALSCSDTLAVLFSILHAALLLQDVHCLSTVFDFVRCIFYLFSSHYTLGLIIYRFICVACPLSAGTLCSKRRQQMGLLVITGVTLAEGTAVLVYTAGNYLECVAPGHGSDGSLWDIFLVIMAVECVLVVIMTIFNVMLICALKRLQSLSKTIVNRNLQRTKRRVSVMSLWLSFITIATFFFYSSAYGIGTLQGEDSLNLELAGDVALDLCVSLSFSFYLLFCKSFRDRVRRPCNAMWAWRKRSFSVRSTGIADDTARVTSSSQLSKGKGVILKSDNTAEATSSQPGNGEVALLQFDNKAGVTSSSQCGEGEGVNLLSES